MPFLIIVLWGLVYSRQPGFSLCKGMFPQHKECGENSALKKSVQSCAREEKTFLLANDWLMGVSRASFSFIS